MDTFGMAEDTTLRDELARDRTILANERTLLSYGRTALALVGVAVIAFHFASPEVSMILGPLSLTVASFVFFWGIHSYRKISARIGTNVTNDTNPNLLVAEVAEVD